MIIIATATRFGRANNAANLSLPFLMRCLGLIFISGPKQLFTSRISAKCAAFMIAMCAPSLLFCAILTIPAMIFQSPHQNAYFHFSQVLEHDPSRWVVLLLAGICTIMSLAIPATMQAPREEKLY